MRFVAMFLNFIHSLFRRRNGHTTEPIESEPKTYLAMVCESCCIRYFGSGINFCPRCGQPVKLVEFTDEEDDED